MAPAPRITWSATSPARAIIFGPSAATQSGSAGLRQFERSVAPSNVTGSPSSRPRMAVRYARISARRAARLPIRYTAVSPEPMPRKVGRGAMASSTEPIALATTAGWRVKGVVTPTPRPARSVAPAASAMRTKGSRTWKCESDTVSENSSGSNPSASARRTNPRYSGTGVNSFWGPIRRPMRMMVASPFRLVWGLRLRGCTARPGVRACRPGLASGRSLRAQPFASAVAESTTSRQSAAAT